MSKPTRWIAGWLVLRLTLVPTIEPAAWAAASADAPASRVAARSFCPALPPAGETEPVDCAEAVRTEFIQGKIDLAGALSRLESCAAVRPERRDPVVPRAGFVASPRPATPFTPEASPAAIRMLRDAGISASGFDPSVRSVVLGRLRGNPHLRQAFREVFGDQKADRLDRLLREDDLGEIPALVLGNSVVIPNVASGVLRLASDPLQRPAPAKSPRVLGLSEYTARLSDELARLEADRLRYLESAALANQTTASVRSFVRSLVRVPGGDEVAAAAAAQAAADHAALLARFRSLQLQLGAEPALQQMAWSGVAEALRVSKECEDVALKRRQWIYLGAGGVAGLIGAAGIVVAAGATGTLGGGVVIAAAIEASIGAYLMYRTERTGFPEDPEEPQEKQSPRLPEAEKRRVRASGEDAELSRGRAGTGQGEEELEFEPEEVEEWDGGEGEGEEDESEEETEDQSGPRENTIPPILPIALPDELAELPPLLDAEQVRELRKLTLEEIQARLDEFLALDAPPLRPNAGAPLPPLGSTLVQELIEEAKTSLHLWRDRRELASGFGPFFVRAELEDVSIDRRDEVFARANGRFVSDHTSYRSSTDLEDLRKRIAGRLVTHCRSGNPRGDLVLAACTDETALTILVVSALQQSGLALPAGSVLGVQAVGASFHPVLYFQGSHEVQSLIRGDRVKGIVGPLYHPASFYYSFLVEHGVRPEIDPEQHLLIAPADPGMEQPVVECAERSRRGVLGRVVDWFRSLVGAGVPSRRGNHCPGSLIDSTGSEDGQEGDSAAADESNPGSGNASGSSGDEAARSDPKRKGVSISVSAPRMPSPKTGGGSSGGGGQGGGGGSGGGASGGSAGGGSSGAKGGSDGGGSGDQAGGAKSGGGGKGEAIGSGAGGAGQGGGSGRGGAGGQGGGAKGEGSTTAVVAGSGEASGTTGNEGAGGGGGGGGGQGSGATDSGTDLGEIAREAVALRKRHENARPLQVRPWRLRADHGYVAPSARVLFADNDPALSRFADDEHFITLSPSEDEAQRRMLEADSFPVFPAGTGCGADRLPPRRVFRRATAEEPGFRYVFCDQDESTVIFRSQSDARNYAGLGAADRPLYLVRLASERLAQLERSQEVAWIHAFLKDPNTLRNHSEEQVDSMVYAAGVLLTFQQTLESALVQSMEELEGSSLRSQYFEMHRQVLQGPLFLSLSEAAYRFNRRLASDPLLALAWANALPAETRQGFFRLYYLFGAPVRWPERWQVLAERYGGTAVQPARASADADADADAAAPSIDFLQILSDPTRVQVDWRAEPRPTLPSIRDRKLQKGRERTTEQKPDPTEAEQQERQDETEKTRGGTGGKGRAGEGDSSGPEKGRQPLQMIRIRMKPEEGDPDRPKMLSNNPTRPGGTQGKKKSTEESASRQEPMLWVTPGTFIDGVLSAWDRRRTAPEAADRVPPVLRFNQRLREHFVREMDRDEIYDGRILGAMRTFSSGGWLRYREAREAMGGSWVRVRALDTGRFAAKYARTAPIRDQDQIRSPNFFTTSGVIIPADLFEPLRRRFAPGGGAIFDLSADEQTGNPLELRTLPRAADDPDGAARESLLRSLELIREQTRGQ